jgi:chemotaxis protein methyltransferase CheR
MNERALYAPGLGDAAAALVRERTGLIFRDARRSSFESALNSAMRRAKLSDLAVYLARLMAEPALLDDLVAAITVGETYFFREAQQIAVIRDQVIPALRAGRTPGNPLRIWSAGCATGEEPYTLAIVLRQLGLQDTARIVATDLSRTALTQARGARYTRWSLRGVPDQVVDSCFEGVDDRFLLAPAIREAVDFRYLNLAEDTYPSLPTGIWGMDLILCRNVLIYFDAETVARVARRLIDSLSDDGWLLLGASDPALSELVDCEVMVTGAGLAYRRPGRDARQLFARAVVTPVIALPVSPSPPPAPEPLPPPPVEPARVTVAEAPVEEFDSAARAYAERDYEHAAELAARSVQRDGGDPAPWIVLVRSLANRGDLDGAGRASAAALDRHRTSAELTYLHAVLLAEAGRHADAATAARRALYLDRGFVVAHLALGAALARLGDTAGARLAFRNAERLLAAMAPGAPVPASDGELAGRLGEMAGVHLRLLAEVAA